MEQLIEYLKRHVKVDCRLTDNFLFIGCDVLTTDFIKEVEKSFPIEFIHSVKGGGVILARDHTGITNKPLWNKWNTLYSNIPEMTNEDNLVDFANKLITVEV